jgi:hypothetical protein
MGIGLGVASVAILSLLAAAVVGYQIRLRRQRQRSGTDERPPRRRVRRSFEWTSLFPSSGSLLARRRSSEVKKHYLNIALQRRFAFNAVVIIETLKSASFCYGIYGKQRPFQNHPGRAFFSLSEDVELEMSTLDRSPGNRRFAANTNTMSTCVSNDNYDNDDAAEIEVTQEAYEGAAAQRMTSFY